jgi:hypothetical protein
MKAEWSIRLALSSEVTAAETMALGSWARSEEANDATARTRRNARRRWRGVRIVDVIFT